MTLNLALVISGDAAGGKRAVQETRTEVRSLGAEAKATAAVMVAANDQAEAAARRVTAALTGQDEIQRRIQATANRFAGISLPGDDASYRQRAADVAAYGAELDRLRAKYNPVFAEIQRYRNFQADIRRDHALGVISADEMAAAIGRERRATLDNIETLKAQGALRRGMPSDGMARQAGFNAGQQVQDIAITAAMGMPISSIALAQGPQLATAIQQGGGWKTAAAGIMSLLSPVNLVTIGLTAAGAAAIQFFASGTDGADKMAQAIERNDKAARELADAYKLAGFNADELGRKTVIAAEAAERTSRRDLERQLRTIGRDITDETATPDYMTFGLLGVGNENSVSTRFGAFAAPILELRRALADGKADFATLEKIQADIENIAGKGYGGFRTFVDDMARMVGLEPEGIRETADVLQSIIDRAVEAAHRLEQLQGLNRNGRGDRVVGPNRMDSEQEAGRRAAEQQRLEREQQLAGDEERFQARLQQQRARTYAERLAAAERLARAENGDNSADLRASRAIAEEQNRQQIELRDAIIERKRALDETLDSARLDVELVGKNAAETARLRLEHQLIAEIRRAAAIAGVKADEEEIARIRQKMGEYQKLVALQSAREYLRGQGEELERLRLETALIGSSAATRERAIALMEAEQEIRRKGYDALSGEAQLIRENAAAIADHNLALHRQAEAWDTVKRSGESAIDSLLEGDWESAAKDIIKSAIDLNIGNPIKNWAFGSGLPTSADLGDIWGKLFGGGNQDAGGLVSSILGGGQNVGAMTVNAGSVMVTGSIGVGGGLGSLAENASRLMSGANGNNLSGDTSVMGKVWDFFSGKGLQPHQVAGIMGNVGAESSFNPGAVNPSSGAFGLFQHWGSRLNDLGGGANLDQQLAFAWKELQSSESGVLEKLLGAKDVRSATAAFAGFERAGGWSKANPEGIELWEQRLQTAQQSLDKFDGTANAANQSLGQFGNGLGQMGNALSQFPAAPGGGSGGILGSLFGGLNSAFSGSKAFNWLSSNPGQFIGLYDQGDHTGHGDPKDVAGLVHKEEFVFSAPATKNIGVNYLRRLHEAGKRGAGFAEGDFTGGTFSAGSIGGRGNAVSGAGSRTVVEIRLTEGLRAELLQQAGDQAVQIVQANDRARSDYYRAGGEAA